MKKDWDELWELFSNPNIKDFKMNKKAGMFENPAMPLKEKSQGGDLYVYSLTIGHLWLINLVHKYGFNSFITEIITLAGVLECNMLEWNIDENSERQINEVLNKYDINFKKVIVNSFNSSEFEEELKLLKEKNHPYHAISRILHLQESNLIPTDLLNFDNASNIEKELIEKSSMINAIYLGMKMTGQVEKNIILPEEIINILREYSPCIINEKELRYYPNMLVQNNYLEALPKFFSFNWDWFHENEQVLFSKLLYSFKVVNELRYSLFAVNGILASTTTRILFDNYWQSKYLIEKGEIKQYREFALDRMRLHILKRLGKEKIEDIEVLMLASKNHLLEPIPINGDYFKKSAREYAIELGIKEDYDKYYEYNSEFIHASLTAVLSGIMVECENPEHMPHLTVTPTSARYIDVIPHIFDILNKHIELINKYVGEDLIELLELEDYFFKDRKSFLENLNKLNEQ